MSSGDDSDTTAKIKRAWFTELEGAKTRNLDAPLRKDADQYGDHDPMFRDNVLYAGFHASECTTYWHVLEIAALCVVGPSAAFGLASSGRGSPRSRFESFCFYMCKRKQTEPKDVQLQEDVFTKAKAKTTVKGARGERGSCTHQASVYAREMGVGAGPRSPSYCLEAAQHEFNQDNGTECREEK